jgi:cardiolipin synthase
MKYILKPKLCSENKINMQMVFSSPLIVERNISDVLNVLISNAKKSIKIITPYFLPTDDLKQSIKTALKGNIKVELLLPGKNDNKDYILTMNRYNYSELLELGCEIYEYRGFIHAKYVIIDDRYVFTGSNNFDFRSLMINFENCLLIDNTHIAKQFNDIYENDKLNSHLFTMDEIIKITNSFSHKWRILMLTLYKPIL